MKNFLNLQNNIDIWIYKKDKYWKLFIRTRTMKRFGSQTFNILIVNQPVCVIPECLTPECLTPVLTTVWLTSDRDQRVDL